MKQLVEFSSVFQYGWETNHARLLPVDWIAETDSLRDIGIPAVHIFASRSKNVIARLPFFKLHE